jgi:predicted O-methyltransferase YrrM
MSLTLPDFPKRENVFQKGRNAYEGYQRGWGLQFGGLRDDVLADPLYRRAAELAKGRSVVTEHNRMNIFLILKFFVGRLGSQNIIEFGSWRGGNAIFMAACLRELHPHARVYALDTFKGMPPTDYGIDLHDAGDFSDVDLGELQSFIAQKGLDNLTLVQGRFEDTVDSVYAREASFGMAHIDCDIYSAVKFSQESVAPRLCPGGYLVYDDACMSSCLGATQAVEEMIIEQGLHSEQIWPQFVFRKPVA